jgi:hypothetical protein
MRVPKYQYADITNWTDEPLRVQFGNDPTCFVEVPPSCRFTGTPEHQCMELRALKENEHE